MKYFYPVLFENIILHYKYMRASWYIYSLLCQTCVFWKLLLGIASLRVSWFSTLRIPLCIQCCSLLAIGRRSKKIANELIVNSCRHYQIPRLLITACCLPLRMISSGYILIRGWCYLPVHWNYILTMIFQM